ncbi:MAG: multicopper oxidase family protein [Nocardioides sp.]
MTSHQRLDRRQILKLGGIAGIGIAGFEVGDRLLHDRSAGADLGNDERSPADRSGDDGFGDDDFGDDERVLASQVPLPQLFTTALPMLPTLKPSGRRNGQDLYELTQRATTQEILPGLTTTVWGYEGWFPGPTIEARRDAPIVVRINNELPVPTTTHLHGGVTPASSDGYPTDLTVPRGYSTRVDAATNPMPMSGGQTMPTGSRPDPAVWTTHQEFKDYEFPIAQRAAMLWYHDHRMDFTGPQVWRGLAGAFIVRDEQEDKLGLPSGEKELVLVICDRAFAENGDFLYPSVDPTLTKRAGIEGDYMEGALGDVILVNGAPWPVAKVATTRYRLRFLNASNARRYHLQLHANDGEQRLPFVQIGSDGGLLAAPQQLDAIPIASGERFDVVVDFSECAVGTEVVLSNSLDQGNTGQVMKFVVDRVESDESQPLPTRLVDDFEILDPAQAVETRHFAFGKNDSEGMWTINDQPFNPKQSTASPRLDTVERWRFSTDWVSHPVHAHLGHFQVLSRGGHRPDPSDAGWKDTVNVTRDGPVEVLIRFTGFTGRYMLHCHNLEHEDMAMMANFTVV